MSSSESGGRFAEFGEAGETLAHGLSSGRVAPAYLFEGPDEGAPREAARLFGAGLLCASKGERPCGVCRSCVRAAKGSHPDLHIQERDKATVISVEALTVLLDRAHASPLEGERQVFIVQPADALAPEGIARYLKTLEEPPASTTFLLVTSKPDRLPDTVRSRCQRVRFAAPTAASVAARLVARGSSAERAARLARLAGPSHARAARFAALSIDEIADAIVVAGRARIPSAATTADRSLDVLRRRVAESGAAADVSPSAPAAGPSTPGEALRGALEDVFHALQAMARDRAGGVAGAASPLSEVSRDEAAGCLAGWARLASLVRRNVAPAALLIEAAAVAARPFATPVAS